MYGWMAKHQELLFSIFCDWSLQFKKAILLPSIQTNNYILLFVVQEIDIIIFMELIPAYLCVSKLLWMTHFIIKITEDIASFSCQQYNDSIIIWILQSRNNPSYFYSVSGSF